MTYAQKLQQALAKVEPPTLAQLVRIGAKLVARP